MEQLLPYIIACPLVGLAGFVDSIAGGGGLISMPAYLIAGLPPVVASATNKVSAMMGTTISFHEYLKNKFVNFKLAIPCIFIAMIFSSIGARVQIMIPEYYLKIFMLIALPITLIFILNKNTFKSHNIFGIKLTKKVYILSFLVSALLGFYDGIYGPATGTFLIMFFVKVVGMNIKESNGMAKTINWATNLGALVLFVFANKAIIPLGICCGLFNMIGCYIGSKMFIKKGADVGRPIMIIVMSIFIIKILLELAHVI